MNVTLVLWLFGSVIAVLIPIIGGLYALIVSHMRDCRTLNTVLVRVDTNMTRLMADIGDNEHGIRGQLNRHESKLGEHSFRLQALDQITRRQESNYGRSENG